MRTRLLRAAFQCAGLQHELSSAAEKVPYSYLLPLTPTYAHLSPTNLPLTQLSEDNWGVVVGGIASAGLLQPGLQDLLVCPAGSCAGPGLSALGCGCCFMHETAAYPLTYVPQ